MLRRSLLIGSTSAALAACTTTDATFDATIARVSRDVQLIADGLNGVLKQLATLNIPALTPTLMSTLITAVSGVQGVAASIRSVTDQAAAQALVQKMGTYVNAVVSAIGSIPNLPPQIQTGIAAAAILLPLIETALNMVLPKSAPPKMQMSPEMARGILAGFAR